MLPLGEKNTCFKGHLTIGTQNFVQCSLPLPIIRHDLQFVNLCQDNLSRMEKLPTVIAESIEVEDAYLFPPNPHVLED